MLASYGSLQNNDGVKFGYGEKKLKIGPQEGAKYRGVYDMGGRPKRIIKQMNSCNLFASRNKTAVISGPVLFESVPAANKTQIRHGDISMFFLNTGGGRHNIFLSHCFKFSNKTQIFKRI